MVFNDWRAPMLQLKLTGSIFALALSSTLCAGMQVQTPPEQDPPPVKAAAEEELKPVAIAKTIVAHPGDTAERPSRRPESTGIQQGIRRDRMHRADVVNKPNRNYDYYGFNYPRREAGAYSRPIRRYSSYGYPSRSYGYGGYGNRSYYRPSAGYYGRGYYGGGRGYYRSYSSHRSYGSYRSYGGYGGGGRGYRY